MAAQGAANPTNGHTATERPLNVLSLFAGIGGLELGLERAGMRVVGQVEIDPFCRRVLQKHWPEVPRHDDVRTCVDWWQSEPRPAVDVVAGGFPCQPVSVAGHGLGEGDERWLWPEMLEVVEAIRPDWVIGENVPGLRRRGLTTVVADLEHAGYRVRVGRITACAVGAPHPRERLFVLAHAAGIRCGTRGSVDGPTWRQGNPAVGRHRWAPEPALARVAHGIPRRLVRDEIRALGNAVVPQVAEYIGRLVTGSIVEAAA